MLHWLFIFAGIIMIILANIAGSCEKETVVYKYMPRTLDQHMQDSDKLGETFGSMFSKQAPHRNTPESPYT
jgi:hypothetical protein